ncbi:penicillin-binding protein 2 [Candidatus Poribacteria bacterium]|nr:penicillin-binding protein 2 [Candidatus Poribacteria bacterium]
MSPVPFDKRLRILLAVSQVLFVVLVGRLFQVQWAQSDRFDARSKQERAIVTSMVKRGAVLDRRHHELAVTKTVYSIGAYPQFYRDLITRGGKSPDVVSERVQRVAEIVARHTDQTVESVRNALESPRGFEWIQRRIEFANILAIEDELRAIKMLWFPRSALVYEPEERRFYPRGSLAAQTIGFTNIDGEGMEGVELAYDSRLKSRLVATRTLQDGKGRSIDPVAVAAEIPQSSECVVLTIDERIQYTLQTELTKQIAQFEAAGGVGIVMDPSTGEVLAMASIPDYDLNHYNDPDIAPVVRRNRATWWPYEPGSVFKVVTLAALLDSGRMPLTETIHCENGSYKPHPKIKTIRDAHPYGPLTFAEVIQKSSNIGTLKAAQRLSQQEYAAYARKLGLMATTGIDIPYERRGNMVQLTDPSVYYGMYFAPWGQGVSVTPLQMLNAVNAIANGGVLLKPRIVKEIVDADGVVVEQSSRTEVGRAISESAARAATDVLVGAVERGTGTAAKLDGIRVAGKTGTSQKASESQRGYEHGQYMSSFVGYWPAEKPRYSMLIVIDEPHGLHYGGQVAAPVFQRVATQINAFERLGDVFEAQMPRMPEGQEFRRSRSEAPSLVPDAVASPAIAARDSLPSTGTAGR